VTRRRTQDERSEETRDRLLTAAVNILSEKGYANFRIAEVSAASAVSRGGMTHHYPSKDALVAGVFEYVFRQLQERTSAKLHTAKDPISALSAIVESGAEFFFAPNFPIYLDIVLAARRGGSLPTTVRALARRQSVSIEQACTLCLVEQGVDEETARDVVGFVWSLLRGLAVKAIGTVETEDRDRIIRFALKAVTLSLASGKSSYASKFEQEPNSSRKASRNSGR
jgi:AcrR family transcriptional regulator